MSKSICCYLCLSTNKTTINIYKTNLQYVYEILANFKITDNECWMCYICHKRLQQCLRLQQLAVHTRGLIEDHDQNKINITFGSLLELSILKLENISSTSTTLPSLDYIIKVEPDLKTEPSEDNIIDDDKVEDTYEYNAKEELFIEFEDPLQVHKAGCEQDLSNVRSDVCSGSKVFELKIFPEHLEHTAGLCADEHTIDKVGINQDIKVKRDIGTEQDEERKIENDCKGPDHTSKAQRYKTSVSCEVCFKMFRYKSGLLRHMKSHTRMKTYSGDICVKEESKKKIVLKSNLGRSHTGKKSYICDICSKELSSMSALKYHIAAHSSIKQFTCDICQKMFLNKLGLKRHMLVHTLEKPYFSCEFCHKKLSQKGYLKTHALVCQGIKPVSCSICPKKFTDKYRLKKHMLVHTGERSFSCDVCPMKFAYKRTFDHHKLSHSVDNPFACNICHKNVSPRNFKVHMASHTNIKPFSCDVCSKKFTTKADLKSHSMCHMSERPYSCHICQKTFARICSFRRHIQLHSDIKPFSCDICQKEFKLKHGLVKHIKNHSGEKPFSCEICFKKFSTKNNLNVHMLIHSGEKPFTCDICQRKFTQKSPLKTHMLIHFNTESFECNKCGMKFRHKSQLNYHMKSHITEEYQDNIYY